MSMQTQRLFVCFELSRENKRELDSYQRELRKCSSNIGWSRVENMHLTLKFLGDTDVSKIDELKSGLRAAVGYINTFKQKFDTAGAFPNMKQPRVLWVGAKNVETKLVEIATTVDQCVATFGFEKENRSFKPHLTLGRVKSGFPQDVVEKMQKIQPPDFIVQCSEITLMRSELNQTGPIYTPLEIVKLS